MRAVMKESIFFLLAGSLEEHFFTETPVTPWQLPYNFFTDLRPRYNDSSWRVIMGKLTSDRQVLKTLRDGKIAFQLTRSGIASSESLFPAFQGDSSDVWSLLLYTSGVKASRTAFQRALSLAGFTLVFPGVAVRLGWEYSEFLVTSLEDKGCTVCLFPVKPAEMKPTPLSRLFPQQLQRTASLQRRRQKTITLIDELLAKIQANKVLLNQTKELIGSTYVSGLSLFSELFWPDLENTEEREQWRLLAKHLDSLMREYAEKNYAWRVVN